MRLVQTLLGVALTGLAALPALAFYDRYRRWRDCFNELGRCYDPTTQDVYLEQAGVVWGGLSAIFLALGLALLFKARRRRIY